MPPRKLTPEAIASAAVDLADREGIEGLTMRSLARHLGVEAMSLYHHFVGKDALLDAMVDRVYGVKDTIYHDPYYQRHIVGAPRVTAVDAVGIRSEASYVVLRTKRDRMTEILSTGRTLDHVVRTDDGLKFAERRVIFDNDLIPNSIIAPL